MKLIAFAAALFGFIAAYWLAFPSYSYRYRLTVEVDTPDGAKSGSSVIEATANMQPQLLTSRAYNTKLKGDATFVDLGDGKNVVALLSRGHNALNMDAPVSLALDVFSLRGCQVPMCDWIAAERLSGGRELPADLLPTLVTFSNPRDPKTARVIEPAEFSAVFGPGYRLKRVSMEFVQSPVTREVDRFLPWVAGFSGVTGGTFDNSWSNLGKNLYASHFRR